MRYIGSKTRILDFIYDVVLSTYGDVSEAVVADLFAGTASVAEFFKRQGAKIISNDYMSFSYALQIAKIKLNGQPDGLIQYKDALSILNKLMGEEGFFWKEYTNSGTMDGLYRRNYFSEENAKKIDAICAQLDKWKADQIISDEMFYLLCANLVDAITKVSNTSGTYGAFLKIDDQRKFKDLILEEIDFTNNGKENECYCEDIFEVIDSVNGDILYLDPPYNSRQYPPYYHILETAVLHDNPSIYGITGRRHYEDKLSPFCMKDKALDALCEVVKRAKFNHIYISYSTDGIVSSDELCTRLQMYGEVTYFNREYRRYKSNGNGENKKGLKEIIIYVKKR